jgi:hypothetical protein
MADNILAHVDVDSYYQIPLKKLENILFKIDQTHAVLSLLSDWISENPNCSLSLSKKRMVDFVLFLLTTLMEQAKQLLPEV